MARDRGPGVRAVRVGADVRQQTTNLKQRQTADLRQWATTRGPRPTICRLQLPPREPGGRLDQLAELVDVGVIDQRDLADSPGEVTPRPGVGVRAIAQQLSIVRGRNRKLVARRRGLETRRDVVGIDVAVGFADQARVGLLPTQLQRGDPPLRAGSQAHGV